MRENVGDVCVTKQSVGKYVLGRGRWIEILTLGEGMKILLENVCLAKVGGCKILYLALGRNEKGWEKQNPDLAICQCPL